MRGVRTELLSLAGELFSTLHFTTHFSITRPRARNNSVFDTIDEITFLCGLEIHYSLDEVRYVDKWENVSGSLSTDTRGTCAIRVA